MCGLQGPGTVWLQVVHSLVASSMAAHVSPADASAYSCLDVFVSVHELFNVRDVHCNRAEESRSPRDS